MLKVVDSHHKVLLHWAAFRSTLNKPPRLVTLDHHTDTSSPFRKFIRESFKDKEGKAFLRDSEDFLNVQAELLKKLKFDDVDSVKSSIEKLNNDEHIVTAIKTGIISSALVVAHNAGNTDKEIYKEHKIICKEVDEVQSGNTLKPDYDCVLETSFLTKALNYFDLVIKETAPQEELVCEGDYILDIDLDYFNTFKSVSPRDDSEFRKLIQRAGLVTIATEPDYVISCAVDKGLTSDYLLNNLLERYFK